mmetsp:Transcript_6554/g.12170  ORF Transcript_6554/g.12170 Transcript_6554/m.12170 type:complete len:170 (+) Transcript_6554:81-590(+)
MIQAAIALLAIATPVHAIIAQRSVNVSSHIVSATAGKTFPNRVALANLSAKSFAGVDSAIPAASPAASPAPAAQSGAAAVIDKTHAELARQSAAEAAEHLKTAKAALNITMRNMNTTNSTVKEVHHVAKDIKHLYTPPNVTKPLQAGAARWHLPLVLMVLVIACAIHLL